MLAEHPIALAFGAIVLYYVFRFFYYLHWNRALYKSLHGPPHSYIWGSLLSINDVVKQQPKRGAGQCLPLLIMQKYNLRDYFYMDPWPFGPATLVIMNTDMLNDIAVKNSLPKAPVVEDFVRHIGGPGNLVTAEGAEWKKWRSAFNPGFSSAHLTTIVPVIVDQAMVYVKILEQKAKNNELFRLEPITTKLTVDIIGKVVLDAEFGSQRGPNELVDTLLNQINWQPDVGEPTLAVFDPRRPMMMKYNTWKMNRLIGRVLEDRFATRSERNKTKCIIDLALEAYLKENKTVTETKSMRLDPEFKQAAISNMKVFLFAGHDTTSSTICYGYYYLWKHPACLAKLLSELNDILGTESAPANIGEKLIHEPHLLNKLEYTTAVVREVLRLQPPASTVRAANKGFVLRDPDTGELLPTENFMLWPVDVGIGRNERYWTNPHTFNPDRFLHPDAKFNKDAWIPFSKGIRNCIGQDLAMMEIKTILAMTVRAFEFQSCYDELLKLKGDGSGYPSETEGVQEQFGDEAYQIQLGSAKPREGMPMRVRWRNEVSK